MRLGAPVLLCVDLQQEFVVPGRPWADPDGEDIAEVCIAVLGAARQAGWQLVHSQLHRGGPMLAGEGLHQSIPGCEPKPGEVLLRRAGISAYAHPDLDSIMESASAGVVMIGFSAPMSLTTTLYDAEERGHPLRLLEEACGSADVGDWSAEHTRGLCIDTARRLGRATTRSEYRDVFGHCIPSATHLRTLAHNRLRLVP
ncbi:isochorismatase family protein [Marinicauda algicola]|uniref:Isochorismatase family protein n=1 Tax=Marinicauda algicola TaxID=2029849 RepID=A0A4S2GY17_9PROT|nr:isochorismatase family protein [Marinicauda algicola]TGY87771.1 isochorismatase family protein [Marinicauda algicola]